MIAVPILPDPPQEPARYKVRWWVHLCAWVGSLLYAMNMVNYDPFGMSLLTTPGTSFFTFLQYILSAHFGAFLSSLVLMYISLVLLDRLIYRTQQKNKLKKSQPSVPSLDFAHAPEPAHVEEKSEGGHGFGITVAILLLIAIPVGIYLYIQSHPSASPAPASWASHTPYPTLYPTDVPKVAPSASPVPTATPDDIFHCGIWDKASRLYSGTPICIVGVVKSTITDESNFYISLEDADGPYQIIAIGSYYTDVKKGDRICATGTLREVKGRKFLYVDDLKFCIPAN